MQRPEALKWVRHGRAFGLVLVTTLGSSEAISSSVSVFGSHVVFDLLTGSAGKYSRLYGYQQHWYSSKNTGFCIGDRDGHCKIESSFIAIDNNSDSDGLALDFCDRYFQRSMASIRGLAAAMLVTISASKRTALEPGSRPSCASSRLQTSSRRRDFIPVVEREEGKQRPHRRPSTRRRIAL